MKYLMSNRVNGVRTTDEDKVVDEEFVYRFTSRETRAWFEGLGGKEELRRRSSGVIYSKSTNPDGTKVREVVFTPVPASES